MKLKILVPTEILVDDKVSTLTAMGLEGSFCIKPAHIDYISILVPGLLYYYSIDQDELSYLAVDRGILIKQGEEVFVSVRNAVISKDIGRLHKLVKIRFSTLDQQQRKVRTAIAKLESDFVHRFMELK
jgi:F-type H+-transporting ATPase subunit epsilon